MKKIALLLVASAALLFFGCVSTNEPVQQTTEISENTNTEKSAPKKSAKKSSVFTESEISGKIFEGDNDGVLIRYEFYEDNTFVKNVDFETYKGTWSYDESAKMLHFVLTWSENGEDKGYLVDFTNGNDGSVNIAGYWYLTDEYISLYETVFEVEEPQLIEE